MDEFADLSIHAQATLLRTLKSRRFRRVGGDLDENVTARVVAAKNLPLEDLVTGERFRTDLYYRIAVHPITIAPLRERREDILPLAKHFLEHSRSVRNVMAQRFDENAERLLVEYDYPGNCRELKNIVERAVVITTGEIIEGAHLQLGQPVRASIDGRVQRFENKTEAYMLLEALEQAKWNRRKASEALGMPYSTLRFKLKVLGID